MMFANIRTQSREMSVTGRGWRRTRDHHAQPADATRRGVGPETAGARPETRGAAREGGA